jgi:hypothetical protein
MMPLNGQSHMYMGMKTILYCHRYLWLLADIAEIVSGFEVRGGYIFIFVKLIYHTTAVISLQFPLSVV